MLTDPATAQMAAQMISPTVQYVLGIGAGIWGTSQAIGIYFKIKNGNGRGGVKVPCKDAPENVESRMKISGIAEDQEGVNKFITDTKLVWQRQNTTSRDLLKEAKSHTKLLEAIATNGKSKG